MTVSTYTYGELFDPQEQKDILECAHERGVLIQELIHNAVMDELVK